MADPTDEPQPVLERPARVAARHILGLAITCPLAVGLAFAFITRSPAPARAEPPSEPKTPLAPVTNDPRPPELAPYMGVLGRLTHKLALSVEAENVTLARFYAYEAIEQLREIQRVVPEYRGHPIALQIDRIAFSPIERLLETLDEVAPSHPETTPRRALEGVIESCNACHRATRHEFIRIVPATDVNPFNQDFSPSH
jgi:hypothetical protein